MKSKQRIELKDKTGESQGYIFRVLFGQIGNSNIAFCRYQYRKYLVNIEENNSWNLYITVEDI